jgi:hypothetical protein
MGSPDLEDLLNLYPYSASTLVLLVPVSVPEKDSGGNPPGMTGSKGIYATTTCHEADSPICWTESWAETATVENGGGSEELKSFPRETDSRLWD